MLLCRDTFPNVNSDLWWRSEVQGARKCHWEAFLSYVFYLSGWGQQVVNHPANQGYSQLYPYPSIQHAGTYCISLCYYLLSVLSLSSSYPSLSVVAVGISCTNFPKPGSMFTASQEKLQRSLGQTDSALCLFFFF